MILEYGSRMLLHGDKLRLDGGGVYHYASQSYATHIDDVGNVQVDGSWGGVMYCWRISHDYDDIDLMLRTRNVKRL